MKHLNREKKKIIISALRCHLVKQPCRENCLWKVYVSLSKGRDNGGIDSIICVRFSQDLVSSPQFISHKVKGLAGRVCTDPWSFPLAFGTLTCTFRLSDGYKPGHLIGLLSLSRYSNMGGHLIYSLKYVRPS